MLRKAGGRRAETGARTTFGRIFPGLWLKPGSDQQAGAHIQHDRNTGEKRVPYDRLGQRTLIIASVTSSGRPETEILLSPVGAGIATGALSGFAALVFFEIPPAGAMTAVVAALLLDAALRAGRRRPPRAPAGRSFMIASSDWSSFPDMMICV